MSKNHITSHQVAIDNCEHNFKSYLRIKPHLTAEIPKTCLKLYDKNRVQIISPNHHLDSDQIYQYQQVFDGEVNNRKIFQTTMIQPINNVLIGYNSTVLIYGMTGTGKTYTMFGNQKRCNRNFKDGVCEMALDQMFLRMKNQKHTHIQLLLSFFEIYNENIRDLLDQSFENLQIIEDPISGVHINQLKQINIEKIQQAKLLIDQGLNKRVNNATKSNQHSSRSHAIVQLNIRKYEQKDSKECLQMQESKLFLVDLAGNQKTTINENKRFLQGVNINKSLLTLGKCINMLSQRKKNTFIPFRDSKLTRILKQALAGNSKTMMIACVSADNKHYEETFNTLKYSTLARKIKNKTNKCIKVIPRKDAPLLENCINLNVKDDKNLTDKEQKSIVKLLASLEENIRQKYTIEKLRQQLSCALGETKKSGSNSIINSGKQILAQLIQSKEKKTQQNSQICNDLLFQISCIKNNVKQHICNEKKILQNQRSEIMRLHDIISIQQLKIKQFQQKINSNKSTINLKSSDLTISSKKKRIQRQIKKQTNKFFPNQSILIHCNENKENKENSFVKANNSIKGNKKIQLSLGKVYNRSSSRNKLQINCSKQTNINNKNFEDVKKTIDKSSFINQQPMLTINLANSELTQSSNQLLASFPSSNLNESREKFIKKLKANQKNNKSNTIEIQKLLQQQQQQQYSLNNCEKSMLRKLKFFQKDQKNSHHH